jgi:hypothetical protein
MTIQAASASVDGWFRWLMKSGLLPDPLFFIFARPIADRAHPEGFGT